MICDCLCRRTVESHESLCYDIVCKAKTAEQGKTLREWTRRHGIKDFFDVGANGVCHAIFPEKGFVRPGFTVIMGDSHTCTHGAFGAFAAGIGTTDLEVGILKGVCAFKEPATIKVEVMGALRPGVFPKDLILTIIRELTVNGATNHVIEFTGPVIDAMDMEGRMTLCNMAVEAGATCGVCLPDMVTVDYNPPHCAICPLECDIMSHRIFVSFCHLSVRIRAVSG